jgi:hypothetical protein
MQPTSYRGLRKQIERYHRAKKPVPQWILDAMKEAKALRHLNRVAKRFEDRGGLTEADFKARGVKPSSARLKGLHGIRLGKASKGRALSGEELEARKLELLRGATARSG